MRKIISVLLVAVLFCGCSSTPSDPAAKIVYDQINEMAESGNYLVSDIERVKERYNSLTDKQKEQVKNYAALLEMEDKLLKQMNYISGSEFLLPELVVSFDMDAYEVEQMTTNSNYKDGKAIELIIYGSTSYKDKVWEEYYINYIQKNFESDSAGSWWYDSKGYAIIWSGYYKDWNETHNKPLCFIVGQKDK